MNNLSFIFPIKIKVLNIYVIFKKRFKGILKNKRSPGAWENVELWLWLQGKHDSGALRLRASASASGPCCKHWELTSSALMASKKYLTRGSHCYNTQLMIVSSNNKYIPTCFIILWFSFPQRTSPSSKLLFLLLLFCK